MFLINNLPHNIIQKIVRHSRDRRRGQKNRISKWDRERFVAAHVLIKHLHHFRDAALANNRFVLRATSVRFCMPIFSQRYKINKLFLHPAPEDRVDLCRNRAAHLRVAHLRHLPHILHDIPASVIVLPITDNPFPQQTLIQGQFSSFLSLKKLLLGSGAKRLRNLPGILLLLNLNFPCMLNSVLLNNLRTMTIENCLVSLNNKLQDYFARNFCFCRKKMKFCKTNLPTLLVSQESLNSLFKFPKNFVGCQNLGKNPQPNFQISKKIATPGRNLKKMLI